MHMDAMYVLADSMCSNMYMQSNISSQCSDNTNFHDCSLDSRFQTCIVHVHDMCTSDAGLATIKTINIGTYTHFSELEHSPSTLKHLHMHAHTHALGVDTNCYSCLPALALPPRSQGCQSAELQAPPSRSPSQSSPQISGSGESAGCHWQRPRLRG